MEKKIDQPKEKFIHRDLSWLLFNQRVLEEALDENNPLLERIKFLAIFVSNLDEFYMVRVAGIKRLIEMEVTKKDRFGYYPQELMAEIRAKIDELMKRLYHIYQQKTLPGLAKHNIYIKKFSQLTREQKKFIKQYFESTLFPIITPMAVDPGHPFPALPSASMAFAVSIRRNRADHFAIVPIPLNVPRLISLPTAKNDNSFILVGEVIRNFLPQLFKGCSVKAAVLFRCIRDSEISSDTDDRDDMLKTIEKEVKRRFRARTVCLEMEKNCPARICEYLCEGLSFPLEEVTYIENHFNLTFLFEMAQKALNPELMFQDFVPGKVAYENIFDRIKDGDFITHLPFKRFYPTIDLIRTAAKDPQVLAIKMTLYRVDKNSAIVNALKEAAQNNKQVTVLIEIRARFDESNNIRWVQELEESGCHVIYGIPGLKVHAKMTLIVRKEDDIIRRYVHLSTGNYNEKTARIYSDIGYFTVNDDFARDISELFNVITGYAAPSSWNRVIPAPDDMRDYLSSLISREVQYHQRHGNGLIIIKVNSLEDTKIIEELYKASQQGVKIELIVRGVCCLIPQIKGLSKNITVRSVVGRFLEHTRIFYFNSNATPRIFLSSADLMTRNLDHRVEFMFEINDSSIKNHLKDVLNYYLKDTLKTRVLSSDRVYSYAGQEKEKFNVQEFLVNFYQAG